MPETWPATLPTKFNETDYTESVANNLLRSQMDYGPAKVRRRTSSNPKPVSGSMQMTNEQLEDLITFVETTTLGGALAFTFPAQRGEGTWLARFGNEGLPTWKPNGYMDNEVAWTVNMKLEILP
jgi:hypothetical protein